MIYYCLVVLYLRNILVDRVSPGVFQWVEWLIRGLYFISECFSEEFSTHMMLWEIDYFSPHLKKYSPISILLYLRFLRNSVYVFLNMTFMKFYSFDTDLWWYFQEGRKKVFPNFLIPWFWWIQFNILKVKLNRLNIKLYEL